MGSGKLSKRARHLAKCRNILAQKIAVRHLVPDLSLAELEVNMQKRMIPMTRVTILLVKVLQ
jgi:hypothetical protein